MAVSVLEVRHEWEALPLHAVAAQPQARDVVAADGAVRRDGVPLHLLRRLERPHAAVPLAQERGGRI
jgi:hypothetical protein